LAGASITVGAAGAGIAIWTGGVAVIAGGVSAGVETVGGAGAALGSRFLPLIPAVIHRALGTHLIPSVVKIPSLVH